MVVLIRLYVLSNPVFCQFTSSLVLRIQSPGGRNIFARKRRDGRLSPISIDERRARLPLHVFDSQFQVLVADCPHQETASKAFDTATARKEL